MRFLLIFIFLIFSADYELYKPDADEYIAMASATIDSLSYDYNDDGYIFANLIEHEFDLRYENPSVQQMSDFYAVFEDVGYEQWGYFTPHYSPSFWNQLIIEQWLTENPTDFAETDLLEFGEYRITVMDYLDGWLIYVERTQTNHFANYWFIRKDESKHSGYSFTEFRIPERYAGAWTTQEEYLGAHLERIQDVTGDGIDDLIFTSGSRMPGFGLTGIYKNVYVISSQFHQILRASMLAERPEWFFENLDADESMEFYYVEAYEDNFLCRHSEQVIYDWDGEAYIMGEPIETWDESPNCELRFAESAMLDGDYETAIAHYQRLESAYAQERMAIAYILLNDIDSAIAIINELEPEPDTIAYGLIEAVNQGDISQLALCRAAYYAVNGLDSYRDFIGLGFINDHLYSLAEYMRQGDFRWETASCNPIELENDLIRSAEYTVNETPLERIASFDIDVTEAKVLREDLNEDGVDEWLIRLPGGYFNWFFVSDNGQYIISTNHNLSPDNEYLSLRRLPNGEYAWIHYYDYALGGCTWQGESFADCNIFRVILWQIRDHQLEEIFTSTIAISYNPVWDDIFIGDTFHGAVPMNPSQSRLTEYRSVIYTWDDMTETYVFPEEERTRELAQSTEQANLYSMIFTDHDYEEAIISVDALLTDENRYEYRYLRAIALEMAGREDEALAEYTAIYEGAWDDSAWHIMAGAHLLHTD